MVDAFIIDLFCRNYSKKKKDKQNILLLQTNDKYKVVKRKPVINERSPN